MDRKRPRLRNTGSRTRCWQLKRRKTFTTIKKKLSALSSLEVFQKFSFYFIFDLLKIFLSPSCLKNIPPQSQHLKRRLFGVANGSAPDGETMDMSAPLAVGTERCGVVAAAERRRFFSVGCSPGSALTLIPPGVAVDFLFRFCGREPVLWNYYYFDIVIWTFISIWN